MKGLQFKRISSAKQTGANLNVGCRICLVAALLTSVQRTRGVA